MNSLAANLPKLCRHGLGHFLAFICVVLTARAHPLLQDAMWIQFEPSLMRVAVNVSLKEVCVAQNLQASSVTNSEPTVLNRALEKEGDYVLQHLKFFAGTNVLAGAVMKLTRPPSVAEPERTFFQFEIAYPIQVPPPGTVTIENKMLEENPYAAGAAWEVSYVVRAKQVGDSAATTWLLGGQKPATIPTGWEKSAIPANPVAPPQSWRTFCEYFRHGIMHILTGWDHLLFVSALVLATRSFLEMFKVIAAFTLAHSLTLALCVFGIFRLPSYVVEPVIALSIIFVALENLLNPESDWPWRSVLDSFTDSVLRAACSMRWPDCPPSALGSRSARSVSAWKPAIKSWCCRCSGCWR